MRTKKELIRVANKFPVYYHPELNGFFVVRQKLGDKIITGDCSMFYADAFTNSTRYKFHKDMLKDCIRVNKRKILNYSFATTKNIINEISVKGRNNSFYRYGKYNQERVDYQYLLR